MIRPDHEGTAGATFERVVQRSSNPLHGSSTEIEVPLALDERHFPVAMPARSPRTSLIVVLRATQAYAAERLARRLPPHDPGSEVIVVCAGRPDNMRDVEAAFRGAKFVHADARLGTGDLREMGMRQAHGDIVLLVGNDPLSFATSPPNLQQMEL